MRTLKSIYVTFNKSNLKPLWFKYKLNYLLVIKVSAKREHCLLKSVPAVIVAVIVNQRRT
jgi:hypothetical protein